MRQEALRVSRDLSGETAAPLSALLLDVWISAHFKTICKDPTSGAPYLLLNNCIEELKRMYSLLILVPGTLDEIKDVLKLCLDQCGKFFAQNN